jgi:hypothetical protein
MLIWRREGGEEEGEEGGEEEEELSRVGGIGSMTGRG